MDVDGWDTAGLLLGARRISSGSRYFGSQTRRLRSCNPPAHLRLRKPSACYVSPLCSVAWLRPRQSHGSLAKLSKPRPCRVCESTALAWTIVKTKECGCLFRVFGQIIDNIAAERLVSALCRASWKIHSRRPGNIRAASLKRAWLLKSSGEESVPRPIPPVFRQVRLKRAGWWLDATTGQRNTGGAAGSTEEQQCHGGPALAWQQ